MAGLAPGKVDRCACQPSLLLTFPSNNQVAGQPSYLTAGWRCPHAQPNFTLCILSDLPIEVLRLGQRYEYLLLCCCVYCRNLLELLFVCCSAGFEDTASAFHFEVVLGVARLRN